MSADLLYAAGCCCGGNPGLGCEGWVSCLPFSATLQIQITYEEELTWGAVRMRLRTVETNSTIPIQRVTQIINGVEETFMVSTVGAICNYNEEDSIWTGVNSGQVLYPNDTGPDSCLHSIFCPCSPDAVTLRSIATYASNFSVPAASLRIRCAFACPAGQFHPVTGDKGAFIEVLNDPLVEIMGTTISNPDNGCTSEIFDSSILTSPLFVNQVETTASLTSSAGCLLNASWDCYSDSEIVQEEQIETYINNYFCGDESLIGPTDPFGIVCAVIGCEADFPTPPPYPYVRSCDLYRLRKRWRATVTIT